MRKTRSLVNVYFETRSRFLHRFLRLLSRSDNRARILKNSAGTERMFRSRCARGNVAVTYLNRGQFCRLFPITVFGQVRYRQIFNEL